MERKCGGREHSRERQRGLISTLSELERKEGENRAFIKLREPDRRSRAHAAVGEQGESGKKSIERRG